MLKWKSKQKSAGNGLHLGSSSAYCNKKDIDITWFDWNEHDFSLNKQNIIRPA